MEILQSRSEVSGEEGQVGRMPSTDENIGNPYSTHFHLLKIWNQIVQRFLNIF